jgi:5-methylcytosine-specific restriction protein A
MRNPKWHRDEIILALDLYFDKDLGPMDSGNPKIIALSELLNRLPIFDHKPDQQTFRNPNGVTLKLSNFKALDPNYEGKGMEAYSKLDKEVFEEFKSGDFYFNLSKDNKRKYNFKYFNEKISRNVFLRNYVKQINDRFDGKQLTSISICGWKLKPNDPKNIDEKIKYESCYEEKR